MTTSTQTETRPLIELLALLAQFPEGCDPAFDDAYEELDREFAALRLTFGNN
jgi:hypothetical protein